MTLSWILFIGVTLCCGVLAVLYLRSQRYIQDLKSTIASLQPRKTPVHVSEQERERSYREKADEAMALTRTFQKFVPRQFVEHFAKNGAVSALELGHAAEDDVAILFCDIRGFTGLSETLSPQELMAFLNSYFLRMNDPIHQNYGFIDKFIGDAIMALFDHPNGSPREKAQDAVQAAIDLRKALVIYNSHRDNSEYPPVNMGIGIHYGPVIMGTVGSDDRMDTTVIGDSVNIAFRLESLTSKYNADIIVSAQTLDTIGSNTPFQTRLLDWVRVKGRRRAIEVYEVLNHLPPLEQKKKMSVQAYIAAGLQCRRQKQWEDALCHFDQARKMNPDDLLAQHHIDVCIQYRALPLPDNWDGALSLS